jgi:hypothetical protein
MKEMATWLSSFMDSIAALSVKDGITLAIAMYGAFLSTFVLFQSWQKDRRRIRVRAHPTFLQYADGSFSTQLTEIVITNFGKRAVVVNSPCVRLPNGKFVTFGDADGLRDFPKRLDDGEKAAIRLTNQKIAKGLKIAGYAGKVRVRPSCTDTIGTRYLGPKWTVDASI